MLRYIAVCCGVLRCVAVCFGMGYIAVCCGVLRYIAVCCGFQADRARAVSRTCFAHRKRGVCYVGIFVIATIFMLSNN
jgi:hypothetical protein